MLVISSEGILYVAAHGVILHTSRIIVCPTVSNLTSIIYLSVYGYTALLLDIGSFLSFLILYTVGRTSWMGDQPVARPLHTHRIAQTQNRHTQITTP